MQTEYESNGLTRYFSGSATSSFACDAKLVPLGDAGSLESIRQDASWLEAPTPAYVISIPRLRRNLEILAALQERTGARVLLAQKCFSMYSLYPLIGSYLAGAAASGLYEARLAHETMGGECHTFSPAYRPEEIEEIARLSSHVIFNSPRQAERFAGIARAQGASCGIRLNPEHSTQSHAIYDPCSPGSRLGTRADELARAVEENPALPDMLDGIHMHTLCEQDSDALEETLCALEEKFARWLPGFRWINLGGGHHITREGYDMARLERCIRRLSERYGYEVYIEPGEAVALDAGHLVASVLEVREVGEDGIRNAILDTSAACHMPDVIEMPYRPPVEGAGLPGEKKYAYRFGGPTCLAGDIIGEYSFDAPLAEGDRVVFGDMAIYTMVKTNTFNGMPLPSIVTADESGWRVAKRFGYEDFKSRL